ncbi:3509_t:CDS:1, partial [Cetraspora pellucida]
VHDLIGDGYCGFQSLSVAIFQEEKKWQDIKTAMKSQLTKQQYMYSILGYDTNQLMIVLSYIQSRCPREYCFYVPECAQLASDMFNISVAIFGKDSTSSLLFLPFNQKPGHHKKPIILHWYSHDYIVLVKLKQNRNLQVPPLNSQYLLISRRLGFSEDWHSLFI